MSDQYLLPVDYPKGKNGGYRGCSQVKIQQYYRGRQEPEVLMSALLLIKCRLGHVTSFFRASGSFLQNKKIKTDF